MTAHHKLSELCNIQSGGTPRRGKDGFYGGNIPWAKIGDIENAVNGYITETQENITKEGLKSINNRLFPEKTVLLAMYGSVGKTAIAGREISTNQAILGLQPKNKDILDFRFLKYYLDFSKRSLVNKARGVALQNISATIVKDFIIPLPSLPIQNEIIKILDQADSIRSKRMQATNLLDEYIKSVFIEMFDGNAKDYKSWDSVELKKLAKEDKGSMRTGPFGSDLLHSEFVDSGIAVIGIDNAVHNKFTWDERRYITKEKYEKLKRYTLHPGDVIVTIMGTVGRSAVIPDDIPLAINTKHLAAISLDILRANPYFISYSLHSNPEITHQIEKQGKGAIMTGLNLGIIKELVFKLPPIELQNKFADILNDTEKLKQKMLEQSKELDNQFQALMQQSFSSSVN